MHLYVNAQLLFVLSLLSTAKYVSFASGDDSDDVRNRAVLVGYGYSSDLQQVTNQACFNANAAKISEPTTRVEVTSAVSSGQLQKTFGVDLSVQAGIGLFAADAKAEYLRSIQENEASVSVNYYVVSREKVSVNINGVHENALTEVGKQYYSDESLYKTFGLQCGDYYIASYDQGAVLFVGLNIKLGSKEDKEKLEGSIGASYGAFGSIAAKIQAASNEKKISGSVQVRGYQFGGDPSELTGIISTNIAECNINNMSGCEKVIQDLLAYANAFGKQIKGGKDLKALGTFDYVPIKRLGLNAAPTVITPEVKQDRLDLANELKWNQHVASEVSSYVRDSLFKNEELVEHSQLLINKAKKNVEHIMDPDEGAIQCYSMPENCKEIKTQIYQKLNNITNNDLEDLQYMKIRLMRDLMKDFSF